MPCMFTMLRNLSKTDQFGNEIYVSLNFLKNELSVNTFSYDNNQLFYKGKGFQGIDIGIMARNLAILYKKSPHTDPEAGLSAGNIQGYQSGAYPAVRELGLNVTFKF